MHYNENYYYGACLRYIRRMSILNPQKSIPTIPLHCPMNCFLHVSKGTTSYTIEVQCAVVHL